MVFPGREHYLSHGMLSRKERFAGRGIEYNPRKGLGMGKPTKIRFRVDPQNPLPPREQIREQVINYVHLGVLAPGARLPAVRELAAQAGLNLKTAFRIYRRLAREGLIEIRPQRGAFVKFSTRVAERSYQKNLDGFLRRVRREAEQLNLSPLRLAQLLAAPNGAKIGHALRCAVVECNREQTNLFAAELRRKLNVDAFPLLVHARPRARARALHRADLLITTDFHWHEAQRWAARHHKEVYRIRLNPAFHAMLLRHARQGLFPLVLTDTSFEPAFRRAVAGTATREVAERLVFVHYRNRQRLRELLKQARRAYVSPLCYEEVRRHAGPGVRLVTLEDMISPDSLHTLRRSLLL